jgi:hypothetical protein
MKNQWTQLECSSGIRDLSIKPQLCLGRKRTLNKTLKQTLELEITKQIVRSSVRLWKTSNRTLWRSASLPNRKIDGSTPVGYLGPTALRRKQCDMVTI